MAVTMVNQAEVLDKVISDVGERPLAVHFWADWAPQCEQMNAVLVELAKLHPAVAFAKVEAENVPELSERFDVTAVPTVVFLRNGTLVDRVDGANVPLVSQKVDTMAKIAPQLLSSSSKAAPPAKLEPAAAAAAGGGAAGAAAPEEESEEELNARLAKLVRAAPVMLFMKGSPDAPECGFSRKIVGLLREVEAEFSTFDILRDPAVRAGLKKFSDWPTYPQLYVEGELIGGLDIVKELAASGELKNTLPKKETETELNERIASIIARHKVMLFMKGTPDAPRCGFSRTTVGILNDVGVEYDTYDILGDNDVRQGIKKYSDWPTFPQLYVGTELIGGLDIIKELQAGGELESTLKGE